MSLRGYMERGDVPGYVAAIARPDGVEIDVAGDVARDTIFRIASLSKPITAAAAMILVEAGVLELDAPIERWLPELANRRVLRALDAPLDDTVPARRAITVRDTLAFTLGLGIAFEKYPITDALDELGQGMPRPSVAPAPEEWLRRLAALPLMAHPGERWIYNTGSDVASVLIARAARQPFDLFLHERLFAPLGMKDTAFAAPAARLPPSYDGALKLYDPPDGQWSKPPAFPSGAGGLVSTIDDYLAFARMLAERGGRVLSPRAVAEMTRDQVLPQQKAAALWLPGWFDKHSWGFGLSVDPDGRYGWAGGLGTIWQNRPAQREIRVLFTQRAFTSPVPPPICAEFLGSP